MAPLPLISQAGSGSGALLTSTRHCSLKFANPFPPLFAKRRGICPPITATNPEAVNSADARANTVPSRDVDEQPKQISFVGQEDVNLEGVIQFEKPNSSASLLAKFKIIGSA